MAASEYSVLVSSNIISYNFNMNPHGSDSFNKFKTVIQKSKYVGLNMIPHGSEIISHGFNKIQYGSDT